MEQVALKDQLGRTHDYLRISLTERCNLRCTYCMPEEGVPLSPKAHLMNAEEVLQLATIFIQMGVKKIRLTGGEPLLRKDAKEILLALSQLPVELTLTTNAILVDRFLDTFKAAGITSLNVSLDTLQANKFQHITKRNEFERVLQNIHLLLEEGFHVKLNAVVMKGMNEEEINDFVALTASKPLHMRFIEFMPFDGNQWQWEKIVSYKAILEAVQERYEIEKLMDGPHSTAKAFRVVQDRSQTGASQPFQGTFAIISSMTEHFCSTCNRLRLTANGKMKNCLFSNEETDLLTALRQNGDVSGLIRTCLERKHAKHGGIKELQRLHEGDEGYSDRSMILIGG